MDSIGRRLREERLRKGLKLSEVSEFTHIRAGLLEAIENDRFDEIPGAFYARSFVRQYARFLGLDDHELEGEILRRLGEPGPVVSAQEVLSGLSVSGPEKSPVLWRTQPASRRLAYATAGALALAGILGVYLGWRQVRARAEAELQALERFETTVTPAAGEESAAPRPEPPPATLPVPQAPSVVPPSPDSGQAAPAAQQLHEALPLVVELSAQRASWIQVHSDGKLVFAGTLQPGHSRAFQASERIRILTGNAGGLQVVRNGSPLGPIGPEGQVRTVELTRDHHIITGPKPRTPETEPPSSPQAPGGQTSPPLTLDPQ